MGNVELLKEFVQPSLTFLAALLNDLKNGADIVFNRQPAEDRSFLGEVANSEAGATVHRHAGNVVAIDLNRAAIDGNKTGDHVKAGGLACTIGAKQSHSFA